MILALGAFVVFAHNPILTQRAKKHFIEPVKRVRTKLSHAILCRKAFNITEVSPISVITEAFGKKIVGVGKKRLLVLDGKILGHAKYSFP